MKNNQSLKIPQPRQPCLEVGMPEAGCHGLQHSSASLCYILKIPAQIAMEIGGWADRVTMDRIYTHVSKRRANSYSNAFTDYFETKSGQQE